jgi:hypothetical protein
VSAAAQLQPQQPYVWQQPAPQPYRPPAATLPIQLPGAGVTTSGSLGLASLSVSGNAAAAQPAVLSVWQQPVLRPYTGPVLTLASPVPALITSGSLGVAGFGVAGAAAVSEYGAVWQQPAPVPYRAPVLTLTGPVPAVTAAGSLTLAAPGISGAASAAQPAVIKGEAVTAVLLLSPATTAAATDITPATTLPAADTTPAATAPAADLTLAASGVTDPRDGTSSVS